MITRVPEGAVSTYAHAYLKEGDELLIQGPFGDFYLRESKRSILLIATGSGLAALNAILHQIQNEQVQRKTALFFGARTRKDLYYYQEIKAFERNIAHFTFTPTLSRPTEEDQLDVERGRVTELIEKNIPQAAPIDAYICGSPGMVQSCLDLLKKKGISEERILFDKFK